MKANGNTHLIRHKLRQFIGLCAIVLAPACIVTNTRPGEPMVDAGGSGSPTPGEQPDMGSGAPTPGEQPGMGSGAPTPGEQPGMPPQDPTPSVTRSGVYSRELTGSGLLRSCGKVSQSIGSTIDLTETGCPVFLNSLPKYFASVEVENPNNEQLTYEWKLFTGPSNGNDDSPRYTSSEPVFNLGWGGTGSTTEDCRISVTITVPNHQPGSPTNVWAGRCTYHLPDLHIPDLHLPVPRIPGPRIPDPRIPGLQIPDLQR